MEWIMENWTEIVAVAGAVVIASRAILVVLGLVVKLTPTPKDDEVVGAWQKTFDTAVAGLKLTALHIPEKDGGDAVPKLKIPPAVLLLPLVLALAMGCAQQARHDFTLTAGKLVLDNAENISTLSLESEASAKAKATQDEKRLDNALMLEIEILVKKQFADDAARQAAILAVVQKYKASVVEVNADIANAADRSRRVQELVSQTREAVLGILEVEARSWANFAAREDLVNKAIVGNLMTLLKGGAQ